MFRKKGQSTLEYVLILTAIVAAVIAIAPAVRTKVFNSLDNVTTQMETQVGRIQYGH